MHQHEEAAFEAKAEKMLAGQREVPSGRNCFAWVMRFLDNNAYRGGFDDTFKAAPGSSARMDQEYCPKCDKKRSWCECKTH